MKVSAWIGIFAATSLLALGACSSDDEEGNTGGSAGSTGGSAGSTGGSAGSTGGSAGSTGGSAGSTGGSAGSTGGSAGSTGGSAGGDGGVDCATCVQASCTAEVGTCAANTDCLPILTCAQDPNCNLQETYDNNPDGQADWDAVETCAAANCPQCAAP